MIELTQLRPRQRRRLQTPQASAVVNGDLGDDAVCRNLVNDWIVPHLVDEWIKQTQCTESSENGDNGERK
jgi:hypothetical protein